MEKEDLIVQQVNKLDSRCDGLDARMRRFETSALALAMLGLILGIGAGYGGLILRRFNKDLSNFQSTLTQAQTALAKLSQVQEEVDRLSNEVGPIGQVLDDRATGRALLGRIERFESKSPSNPYAWDGYYSDSRGLADFAVEYVTLAAEDTDPANKAVRDDCYDELVKAAETVKGRAKEGLKGADTLQYYEMHWKQKPQDFENLLAKLKQQRESQLGVLTGAQTVCYQVAFPNWLANNGAFIDGTYKVGPGTNSADCRTLLGISQ
jgi:hypothetical protein